MNTAFIIATLVKESNVIRFDNGEYVFKEPIEHPTYKGYFIVPMKEYLCITREGLLRNSITGLELSFCYSKPQGTITGGYAYNRKGKRHRLLAVTFLPTEVKPGALWVNHKNGIPGDDRLDNLEWVTPGENVLHAYRTGLHPNRVKPVSALNWETGESKEFNSIAVASEYTGITYKAITSRLRRGNEFKYDDGWRFKKPTDMWDDMVHYCYRASNAREVLALNVKTLVTTLYSKVEDVATATGVDEGTIRKHAREKAVRPTFGYIFRYADTNVITWPAFSDLQLEYFKTCKPGELISTGFAELTENGEVIWVGNTAQAEERFGYTKSGLAGLSRVSKPTRDGRYVQLIQISGK